MFIIAGNSKKKFYRIKSLEHGKAQAHLAFPPTLTLYVGENMYYFRIFVSSILLTWIIIVIFISKSRCQRCLEKVILWHHHWYSPWSFVLVNILKKGRRKKNSMEVHLVNVIFIEITTQRSFYCIILFVIFVTFSAFMKWWSNLWGLGSNSP